MKQFLMNLIRFRLAQKSARGAARMVGLGRVGLVIGLIGGWRALKAHRQTQSHA
jgi:hypothetical protein